MSAAKQSIDCESCAYCNTCVHALGTYGVSHDCDCFVPAIPGKQKKATAWNDLPTEVKKIIKIVAVYDYYDFFQKDSDSE